MMAIFRVNIDRKKSRPIWIRRLGEDKWFTPNSNVNVFLGWTHVKIKTYNYEWRKAFIPEEFMLSKGRRNPIIELMAQDLVIMDTTDFKRQASIIKKQIRNKKHGFYYQFGNMFIFSKIAIATNSAIMLNSLTKVKHHVLKAITTNNGRYFAIYRVEAAPATIITPVEEYKKGRDMYFDLRFVGGYVPKTLQKNGWDWGLVVFEHPGELESDPDITFESGVYYVMSKPIRRIKDEHLHRRI